MMIHSKINLLKIILRRKLTCSNKPQSRHTSLLADLESVQPPDNYCTTVNSHTSTTV